MAAPELSPVTFLTRYQVTIAHQSPEAIPKLPLKGKLWKAPFAAFIQKHIWK